jgi:hypothetical protein
MTPFDVINSITYTKKPLVVDEASEKMYNAYNVNKGLSYFKDTIFHAQEMNISYHLDSKLQHDYLFNSIRKQKRFAKWIKPEKDADLEAVKIYFNYGYQKAKEAMSILSKDQLIYIKEKVKGGACER